MLLPRREVLHPEREMIVAVDGGNGFDAPADQVQFLGRAEPEPCARKIERRTRQPFQPQDFAIKCAAPLHVHDVNGHMIEFMNFHREKDAPFEVSNKPAKMNRGPILNGQDKKRA